MTWVPVLYSDRKLPLSMEIEGSDGKTVLFKDGFFGIEFKELSEHRYKEAVEQEIRVIRPVLPEYDYYFSMPGFNIDGSFHPVSHALEHMFYVNQYLKKAIIETGAEVMFLNVCLGDDYECIDDIDFMKIDLNQSTENLIKSYSRLYNESVITEFYIGDKAE